MAAELSMKAVLIPFRLNELLGHASADCEHGVEALLERLRLELHAHH